MGTFVMMKLLRVAGCLPLLALASATHAYASKLTKAYDQATGTDEPFYANGAWQVMWNSGDRSSGITVRIVDTTTGGYVSEVDGVSANVRVDASGAFRITVTGARSRYKVTISTLP